jgi:hypothetical protein
MVSRQKERFGGLFIATIGAILTIWNWHVAISAGHFYAKAAMIGPAVTIIGLALVLFPGYKTERIERGEDISQLTGIQLLTPRWWGVLAIALGSGFINLAALKGWQL